MVRCYGASTAKQASSTKKRKAFHLFVLQPAQKQMVVDHLCCMIVTGLCIRRQVWIAFSRRFPHHSKILERRLCTHLFESPWHHPHVVDMPIGVSSADAIGYKGLRQVLFLQACVHLLFVLKRQHGMRRCSTDHDGFGLIEDGIPWPDHSVIEAYDVVPWGFDIQCLQHHADVLSDLAAFPNESALFKAGTQEERQGFMTQVHPRQSFGVQPKQVQQALCSHTSEKYQHGGGLSGPLCHL